MYPADLHELALLGQVAGENRCDHLGFIWPKRPFIGLGVCQRSPGCRDVVMSPRQPKPAQRLVTLVSLRLAQVQRAQRFDERPRRRPAIWTAREHATEWMVVTSQALGQFLGAALDFA